MPAESRHELHFLTNLGLVVTYKCQIACPHCVLEAGPRRTEEMALEDAKRWIREAVHCPDSRFRVLSLTGGEPFCNLELLRDIAAFAGEAGLLVTAVTNAFWARTFDDAVSTLRSAPAIRMLAVSADAYHQAEIPLERVRHAVAAAEHLGLEYNVAVCTEDESDATHLAFVAALETFAAADRISVAKTLPVGRGALALNHLCYPMSPAPAAAACWAASTPMVFPDGRVVACIGPVISLRTPHPLLLGNAKLTSLTDVLTRAQRNSVLHALRVWGPRRLVELLQEAGYGSLLPQRYVEGSVCAACFSLMSDARVVAALNALAEDAVWAEKVAYGRLFYLKEEEMVTALSNACAAAELGAAPSDALARPICT